MSDSVGPLYYATVVMEKISVRAMVNPGSPATTVSFRLKTLRKLACIWGYIQPDSLKHLNLNLTLYDYSQKPIPVGASVELTFKWKEQKVTTYVSVRSGSRQPCLL